MIPERIYTFVVAKDATKGQIKEAVEKTFGVNVLDVHTVTIKGKVKRRGAKRTTTQLPSKKKAYVRIQKDQQIELLELEQDKK